MVMGAGEWKKGHTVTAIAMFVVAAFVLFVAVYTF
ncbi:MAG: DUF3953 domain-containing protein [Bacillus sp. (in: firmicutes)]